MPGRSAITCKVSKDLHDSIHGMAEARAVSVNQLVHSILQSYVVTGTATVLPTVLPPTGVSATNSRQLAMATLDSAAPALVKMLLDKAQSGDRDSAIYCLDRLMGKPRQQVDQTTVHVQMDARYFQEQVRRLLGTDATPVAPPLLSEGNALPDSTDTPGDAESDVDSGT